MKNLDSFDWLTAENVFLFRSDGDRTHAFKNRLGFSNNNHSFTISNLPKNQLLFGFMGYDLKNEFENLSSQHPNQMGFPDSFFIDPEKIIEFTEEELHKFSNERTRYTGHKIEITPRTLKQDYIAQVTKLKAHILRGDIYEVNYCMEFYAENVKIDPFSVYIKLNELTHAPFSCFVKTGDKYILCASPERFLKKNGNQLISQPMKGTIRRGKDTNEDEQLKNQLFNDPKERNENVMIVDLVRNDLSRIAKRGSVKVEELYGIYSFENIHQMISTVSCELEQETEFKEIISKTFPMGSMTGAPKVSAMQLIEENEDFRRGLYSGSIGYLDANGDFDFNVVIRSIFYNAQNSYLSFSVGSAITAGCDPEKEYEECLLKAKSLIACLQS